MFFAEIILWCVVVREMQCTTCLVPMTALTLQRQAGREATHSHPASAAPVVPDLVESACVHMYTHYVYIYFQGCSLLECIGVGVIDVGKGSKLTLTPNCNEFSYI